MSLRVRLPLLIALTLFAALLATYAWDPFNAKSWSPFERILGIGVFRNASDSMEPTISERSIFLSVAPAYLFKEPRSGDVVVFRYPPNPSIRYVKRIVASGGDTISIEACRVRLNGELLSEPYAETEGQDPQGYCSFGPVKVPLGKYFVLGDNRLRSADSRIWGFLPREYIFGKAMWQAP